MLSREETPFFVPCPNVYSAPKIILGAFAVRGCVGAYLFLLLGQLSV